MSETVNHVTVTVTHQWLKLKYLHSKLTQLYYTVLHSRYTLEFPDDDDGNGYRSNGNGYIIETANYVTVTVTLLKRLTVTVTQ